MAIIADGYGMAAALISQTEMHLVETMEERADEVQRRINNANWKQPRIEWTSVGRRYVLRLRIEDPTIRGRTDIIMQYSRIRARGEKQDFQR